MSTLSFAIEELSLRRLVEKSASVQRSAENSKWAVDFRGCGKTPGGQINLIDII